MNPLHSAISWKANKCLTARRLNRYHLTVSGTLNNESEVPKCFLKRKKASFMQPGLKFPTFKCPLKTATLARQKIKKPKLSSAATGWGCPTKTPERPNAAGDSGIIDDASCAETNPAGLCHRPVRFASVKSFSRRFLLKIWVARHRWLAEGEPDAKQMFS